MTFAVDWALKPIIYLSVFVLESALKVPSSSKPDNKYLYISKSSTSSRLFSPDIAKYLSLLQGVV